MIIEYKYGFKHNNVLYGWQKPKRLFRLPQMIGKRFYPLKELELRKEVIGGSDWEGFLLYGKSRKSFNQCKSMSVFINFVDEEFVGDDCPF